METTITEAQLKSIRSGAGRIDEYRSMVNYETGTNKGYVRFSVDDHGKFTVQKFNNKVDVPLSLRHNTSATHNKTVREKFAQALESDMRFMSSEDRDEINDMILRPKVENKAKDGQAVDQGKALSRRDVKEVFKKFDEQFNTLLGRKKILSNFFREALKEPRYKFSDDFVQEYLAPIDRGIAAKLKACLEVGDPEVPAKDPRKTMKMNESEFRKVLHQLGQVMDQFKIRQNVSDAVKGIAIAASKKADSFGVSLLEEDVSKVRAALSAAFKASNVEDVDLGFAQRGTGLELFIKTVLPVMVRQGAENIRDFGGDGKDPYEIAEGGLSFGEIFEAACRFVDGARGIAAAAKDAKLPEDDQAKKMLGDLAKAPQTFRETRVEMQAKRELLMKTALPGPLREQLAQEMGSLTTKEFDVLVKLEEFAAKFVRENFTKAALDMPVQLTDFKKKAREHINKMVVAGQLNYGERWAVPDPTQKTGVRVYQGRDVQYFLTKVSDGAIELTNSLEGGMTMIEQLHVRTIPKIVNRKILNAVASDGAARPNLGDDAVKDALKTIEVFGNAYMNFRRNRAGSLFGSTKKAFTSQLGRLFRNGSIGQKEFSELSDDCDRRLKSALDRAIERFFDSEFKKDDDSNIVARAEQSLENLFLEEKGKLVGEMNRMFATVAAMKAVKFDDRVNLLNSTLHINNFLNDIKKKDNNQPVLKGGFVGETGLVEVLDKLYFSVLAKALEKALKNVEPGNPPKNLTDSVKDKFFADAKGLIEKVNKFSVKLDELLKKFVDGGVDTAFEVNGFRYYSSDLGENELKGVKEAISADVVLSLKYSADEAKRRMLFNSEIYANKREVSDFVDDLFRMVDSDNLYDSKKNIALVYKSVLDERVSAVNSWINTPTESNVKLSDDLAAGAKSRVLGEGHVAKSSAEAIEKGELDGIVKVAVGEVLARAQKFALSYSMGGRDAFMARVNAEVDTRVKQLVTAFAKFRADVVGKTDEMISKYADALDRVVKQQKKRDAAPGESLKTIKDIRQALLLELCNKSELLLELCNKSELPSTTKFLEVFVEKVEGSVTDSLVKEALEHVRKSTEAWEKCMPEFEEGVRGGV